MATMFSIQLVNPRWGKKKKKRSSELGKIYAPVLPFLDIVPVSQAPSLTQNRNALFPVNASVVPYSTD